MEVVLASGDRVVTSSDCDLRGAESLGDAVYIAFNAKPAKDCVVFSLENN